MDSVQLMRHCSYEITAKDIPDLDAARTRIPPGSRISITSLPGEKLHSRIAAAVAVRRLGFVPVPHIAARSLSSKQELVRLLERLRGEVGAEDMFVVAGDIKTACGPYEDALALIRDGSIQRYGIRTIGIAGYPEGHPDIPDDKLKAALHEKVAGIKESGAICEIVTQFGFDADAVRSWLDAIRAEGVNANVRIGLAGPSSVKTLLRFAAHCGVTASTKVMLKYGISMRHLLGPARPDKLVEDLAHQIDEQVHGSVQVHVFPFGGVEKAAAWIGTRYAHGLSS